MEAIIIHPQRKNVSTVRTLLSNQSIFAQSMSHESLRNEFEQFSNALAFIVLADRDLNEALKTIEFLTARRENNHVFLIDTMSSAARIKLCSMYQCTYLDISYPQLIGAHIRKQVYQQQHSVLQKFMKAYDVFIDLERRVVKRHDKLIDLKNKEFSLLEYFVLNKGKLLTRTTILEQVWDRNAHFGSNTLDVHVNRLRRKLDDPFKIKLIHTVHSIGYRFDNK